MKKLLLGERSNRPPGYGSDVAILPSSTASRLDWCAESWRTAFEVRNVWNSRTDVRDGRERVRDIIRETRPDIVVTLGITVSLLFDIDYHTPWLSATKEQIDGHEMVVVKFPHTSGRNRVWNDQDAARQAQALLTKIVDMQTTDTLVDLFSAAPVVKPPVAKTDKIETSDTHEISTKYYKVYNEYVSTCSCGRFSVSGKIAREVEAQTDFHIQMKTKAAR